MRMGSRSKDAFQIRKHLSRVVREARARGDEDINLDVGNICAALDFGSENRHALCCSVLDSEQFAKAHALWYHHRMGVWGTASAKYLFLLDQPGYKAATQPRPKRPQIWLPTFAIVFALLVVAGAAFVLLQIG